MFIFTSPDCLLRYIGMLSLPSSMLLIGRCCYPVTHSSQAPLIHHPTLAPKGNLSALLAQTCGSGSMWSCCFTMTPDWFCNIFMVVSGTFG